MILPRDRKGLERDEMLPDDRTGHHVGFPEMGLPAFAWKVARLWMPASCWPLVRKTGEPLEPRFGH
ncbi:hypothetical protein NS228_21490 [Methylobacterium indicum]|nr:hypothetical protein NS229_26455 [Methylobacterium indicum]KTS32717.1 hypothetical protein NS228_21490 [Methylobacterium indicum]KTS53452.1 hypothetical protein NS230_05850 [Methylobacterium indicum]